MIYILLIITIVAFAISYLVLRDSLSPSGLICISYIISVFLAVLNINNWGINLANTTVNIIGLGLFSFIVPSVIITYIYKTYNRKTQNKKKDSLNNVETDEKIIVDKRIILFFVIIEIITTFLYIYYMMKNLGTGLNLENFSGRMQSYRKLAMTDSETIFEIPFLVKQMIKLSKAFIYCYSFVVIYNCSLIKEKVSIKKNIPISLIIAIAVYSFQSVFSASRFNLAVLFVYLLLVYYVLFFTRNGRKKFGIKTIFKIFLIVLIIGLLFFTTKELFGRSSDKSFIEYLGSYFGGSIELFDLYMKNPVEKSTIWGKESFTAINNDLFGYSNNIHLEFRQSNGIWIGNVYTALRNYYQDFGLKGVIILQVIYSIIMTNLYQLASLKRFKGSNFILCIYALFGFTLILHSYRDFFFSTIVSFNYLNIIFYMFVIMIVFKNIRIK